MKLKSLLLFMILGILVLAGCSSDSSTDEDSKNKDEEKQEETVDEEVEQEQETDTDSEDEAVTEEDTTETEESGATDETEVQEEATQTTTSANGEVVNTTFEGISFDIPANAQNIEVGDIGYPVMMYILDEVDRTNFNVILETLPEPMALDEYIELATSYTDFEYLSNENFNANGMEWNEVVSLNHQEGTKLNQRTFIIDNQVYIFSYASLPENYEKHLEVFKGITDSVTIN